MSATDEAIKAIAAELETVEESLEGDYEKAAFILGLLSADVLARLAVERGGLVQAGWRVDDEALCVGGVALFEVSEDPEDHADEVADDRLTPVYRIAEAQS